MIAAVVFDLDDTMFLERDFIRSGFRAVDRYLKEHIDGQVDWFGRLWKGFESGVRGDAFNRLLAAAGQEATEELIQRLVRCYRDHRPDIAPLDDVVPAITALGLPPERMGVITDGPVVMQQRKLEALDLARFFEHVIYTDAWGVEFRKPHPRAFETFERLTGCPPPQCAYVSDNPAKDFRAPHERGWTTVRVIRPGGLNADRPSAPGEVDHTIRSFAELPEALATGS